MRASTRPPLYFHGRAVAALISLISALIFAGTAEAHEVRYIASYGDNANLCTRDAPCKTLQKGINTTPAGRELIVLDSGDYGNGATIRKSITISAVSVSATLGGTITIDAAGATVMLRGLHLNGTSADAAANGIDIVSAAAVHVENCEIQNFWGNGISFLSAAGDPALFVYKTVSRNNGLNGLYFVITAGEPRLTVDRSHFERNGIGGMTIGGAGAAATITRTIASGNTIFGISQAGGTSNITWATAENNSRGYHVAGGSMTLEQSVARANVTGVFVQTGGIVRLSGSVVTDNGTGLSLQAGSTLLTRVNNTVSGNTTDVSGTVTPLGGI